MPPQVKEESLKNLIDYYSVKETKLDWPYPYLLPFWLQSWWDVFGGESEQMLRSVWQEGELIGIAPMARNGEEVLLIGSPDVCDYLDFIIEDGREELFFNNLIFALRQEGVRQIRLHAQRPDAAIFRFLAEKNRSIDFHIYFKREDRAYEIVLPGDWESYLASLKKKQRHEVRRKMRRLGNETEGYNYRVISEEAEIIHFLPEFLELFGQNPEKADFLTGNMELFFKQIISSASKQGLVRFGLLEIDGVNAAAILYFEYKKRLYLYNSGYNSDYANLSSGLLSKIFSIKNSIEAGQSVYDFLKGEEVYKSRLGGSEVPIYRVIVNL